MYNNDYEKIIKSYLRNHRDWKAYTENLRSRMVDLRAKMQLDAVPKTTRFGYDGGGSGGWVKPSPEEAACIRKENNEAMLLRMEDEYLKYHPVVESMERFLDQLSGIQREIVEHRSIQGEQWSSVAMRVNLSESACRAIFRKAIKRLTGMYFGPKAAPEQGSLFLPGGQIFMSVDKSRKK
ncbi:hypothetical protein [Acidaminococcus sp.]|uniref:hypothetical protein n=1 Tax=Acidaminococcus sp. TaxID=1872103 RepID=UPI003D7D71D3